MRVIYQMFDALSREYTENYGRFYDEYTKKAKNEIDSIRDGSLKLYAVDKSTEIYDWSEVFDHLERAFRAFKFICEKPISHLKSVNEVRPVETVKRIGHEAIPYLASHSEDWLAKTASGLKPARLYSRVEDDDYQIYENRVIKTLLDQIISFLRNEYKLLKDKNGQLKGIIDSSVQTGSFGFDESFQKAVAELLKFDGMNDTYRSEALVHSEKLETRAHFLLNKYRTLRCSRLYRYLKRAKTVSNPINETNILLFDKHYNVAFKLWKALHTALVPQIKIAAEVDTSERDFQSYKQFCMTLAGYAAHVLNFEIVDNSCYRRKDDIRFQVIPKDSYILLEVKDKKKHEVEVSGGVFVPIEPNTTFKGFFYDGITLFWDNETSMDEFDEFAGLFKNRASRGKEQSEEKKKYIEIKRLIVDKEREYVAANSNRVVIIPAMVQLQSDNRNLFKSYVSKMAEEIVKETGALFAVVALPKAEENEQKIVDYAYLNNEKVMFVPVSMYDINSFRRIQNILLRQVLAFGKDKCPYCGGELRMQNEYKVCDSCNQLTIITTKCPESTCHGEYTYLSYDVKPDTIAKMQAVDSESFYQADSLYQYKDIVKMVINDGKIRTLCPHCGK